MIEPASEQQQAAVDPVANAPAANAPAAGLDAAPTGTLTFLFTDIEGSTRLEQDLGRDDYARLRERHRELLRAAFLTHQGVEQGTQGDSFFVVFGSAREALVAAVEAQRSLLAELWPANAEVRVRMGLHAGEAVVAGGSLVGIDINRAARIAAAGHGGQILASDAIRGLLGAGLPPGIALRALGSHRLKDLRSPELLFQVVAEGLTAEFPALRSIDARPNNLPTQLTSFVGREVELAEAGRLLETNRLVTLTGPGGTGKTRLSLQVASAAAERFRDGVFFVALETVRDPVLVPSRLMAGIGLPEPGGRAAVDVLREWLADRQVLFVLDNLEQVLGVGPLIADLLRSATGLTVLATSRAPLRISGEQEFPVPGLPTPPDPGRLSALDPQTLTTYEAVRLFIARASAVRPGFTVTNENAPAVAAICARLHGMPLALELAAARVKLLSPEAILARLDNQLALLSGGSRDLPERQQTLRGAIAWSYDILEEGQRRLLDRLSVFSGGIDLEAAEAVCGPASELGPDVVDGIVALADQSLVRSLESEGEPRFELLETIREFAAEMLAGRAETEAIRDRHSAWFLALAERLAPELGGESQREHLDRLDREHDNLRAVLDRAYEAQDGETEIRLLFALWRFWQKRGHLDEARRRVEAVAAQPWSKTDGRLRARLMEALGGICWWQGDIEAMKPAYAEAVDLWRVDGDKAELANALYNWSFVFNVPVDIHERGGDPDPEGLGPRALEEALALYREIGDERGQANVLWGLGNRAFFRDLPGHGEEQFHAALELFRKVRDTTMEAWSLHMVGGAMARSGNYEPASEAMRAALRTFRDAGDTAGINLALDDVAQVAQATGDLERAARLHGAARALVATTGATLADYNQEWMRDMDAARLEDLLPADELARLAAEGAAMTLDEIVAYALEERASETEAPGDAPAGTMPS